LLFSWHVPLLPYLESENLFDQFNGQDHANSEYNSRIAVEWRPQTLICPSDSNSAQFRATTNYVANTGTPYVLGNHLGPINDQDTRIDHSMIKRGLTNVACLAECGIHGSKVSGMEGGFAFDRGRIRYPSNRLPAMPSYSEYRSATLNAVASVWDNTLGENWYIAYFQANGYNHAMEPNSKSCKFRGERFLTPTSYHAGGINTLRCDGGVLFISNQVDLKIWVESGTIDLFPIEF
jgi:hypothetical protein